MIKVLFVCHGNICRSPMCEFILKDMVQKRGIADLFQIESAATTSEEIWGGVGNPVYPPARKELAGHGISCEGKRARKMTRADYDCYNYIIGMDRENLYDMRQICGGDPDGKISLLLDYTDHPRDVADPWYTGNFKATWQDAEEGCLGFLKQLGYS